MADIFHLIGSDLDISPNGNFTIATDEVLGQQRVLRRLLTNPKDYPWELDYGAGLSLFVGQVMNQNAIIGKITSQMRLEKSVSQLPPPTITVSATTDNSVVAHIRYLDSTSQNTSVLDFTLDG